MLKFKKIIVLSMILALLGTGSCFAANPYDVSGIDLRDFLNTFRLGQVPSWDKYAPRDSSVERKITRHFFSRDKEGNPNIALWTHNDSGKILTIAIHNDGAGLYLAEWTNIVSQLYEPPTVIKDGGNYYDPAVMRLWEAQKGASLNGIVSIAPRVQETKMRLDANQ